VTVPEEGRGRRGPGRSLPHPATRRVRVCRARPGRLRRTAGRRPKPGDDRAACEDLRVDRAALRIRVAATSAVGREGQSVGGPGRTEGPKARSPRPDPRRPHQPS
jgi:hypothetical protein